MPVQQYAGFTPQQQLAFGQTQQYAQSGQPYFQQAGNYFNQSASPISGQQIGNYLNPYANYVMANLAETQGQQMQDLTGRLAQQAGGVGASRIEVGRDELLRQQDLARGQTLSGIYGQALSAAQQDAMRQQAAGYGMGNLGATAQGAALQGAQANFGMGTAQQNLAQQQLNAQYANTLQRLAYPYQNTQYLAGITGGLAGALGGTTSGYAFGQPPVASPLSNLAALGQIGTGVAGVAGAFGNTGGSTPTGATYGGYDASGNSLGYGSIGGVQYPAYAAHGGRIGYDDGGGVQSPDWMHSDPYIPNMPVQSQAHHPELHFSQPQSGSGSSGNSDLSNIAAIGKAAATIAPLLLASQGGAVDNPFEAYYQGGHYQDGGDVDFSGRFNALTQGTPQLPQSSAFTPEDAQRLSGVWRLRTPNFSEGYKALSDEDQQKVHDIIRAKNSVYNAYSDAGGNPSDITNNVRNQAALYQYGKSLGYQDGGDVDFASRYGDWLSSRGTGDYSDYTINKPAPERPPLPRPRPPTAPQLEGVPIRTGYGSPSDPVPMYNQRPVMNRDDTSAEAGPRRVPVRGGTTDAPPPAPAAEPEFRPTPPDVSNIRRALSGPVPYPDVNPSTDVSRGFAKSPWMALIASGFGTLAGGSPYAGVNIGKGGLEGIKTLMGQREALQSEEAINQRARQLALSAEKEIDALTKIPVEKQASLDIQRQSLEQQKWQTFYDQEGNAWFIKPGERPILAMRGTPGAPGVPEVPTPGTSAGAAMGKPPIMAQQAEQPPFSVDYAEPDESSKPKRPVNPKTGELSTIHTQESRAALERVNKAGEAANSSWMQIQQLEQALNEIDKTGGLLATGAYAGRRMELARIINTASTAMGLGPITSPEALANAEEANKITVRLGQQQAQLLGNRESQQVIQQTIAANPGIENTPAGRKLILEAMKANIERAREKQQYVIDTFNKYRSAAIAEAAFERANPPEKYIARAARDAAAEEKYRDPTVHSKAVAWLRAHKDDPSEVAKFNKIYHNTAKYFLQGVQRPGVIIQ